MSKEHLIPINQRSPEEQFEICSKGGRTKSPRKKLAARIRELKKKGLKDDDAQLLSDMMIEGDVLDLDILIGLQKLIKGGTDKTKSSAYSLMLRLSEKLHGSNKIENLTNIQINIAPKEELDAAIKHMEILNK